jgi:ATP-binding cassette subfamily B protein
MTRRAERTSFIQAMALLGRRFPLYLAGSLARGLTLAYCFNLVMAFVFMDVLNASMGGDGGLLLRGTGLALGTFLLGMPVVCLGWYGMVCAVFRTAADLRQRLFGRLAGMPLAKLDEEHSGDRLSRCTSDLDVVLLMYGWLGNGVQGLSMGLIGMASILALEWRLGLIGIGIGGAMILTSALFARPIRRRSDVLQCALGKMVERLSDLLAGLVTARMFQQEDRVYAEFARASDAVARAKIAQAKAQAWHDAAAEILDWVQTLGVLAMALVLFGRGGLLVGAVWAIVRLQGNASAFYLFAGHYVTAVQRGLSGAHRLFEILDQPDEGRAIGAPIPASRIPESAVSLRNISFCYPAKSGEVTARVLNGVTLSAEAGEVVAIVGPSGGGKSTLMKILLGYYPDYDGEVLLHGQRQGAYSLRELREAMAYVPQDAYLFNATIEENIGFGRPGATHDDIESASRTANAHEFILALPEGYKTQVGEHGAKLSGGQRQRIAIARAILKDAPILLLDEATSALDSASEKLVQEALKSLISGRTTIAVAHRLSTIGNANRIYVMDRGRIVEQGRHAELLAEGGLYRRLFELQFAS